MRGMVQSTWGSMRARRLRKKRRPWSEAALNIAWLVPRICWECFRRGYHERIILQCRRRCNCSLHRRRSSLSSHPLRLPQFACTNIFYDEIPCAGHTDYIMGSKMPRRPSYLVRTTPATRIEAAFGKDDQKIVRLLGQVALDIVCAARFGYHVHFAWPAPHEMAVSTLLARWVLLLLLLLLYPRWK